MNRPKTITTKIQTMFDETELLTGNEDYPITGDALIESDAKVIWSHLKGLKKHWDCVEKANRIRDLLGGKVAMGSMLIWSKDMLSNYGFFFNPPFEVHAWNILEDRSYVDFSLPTVIEAALKAEDALGPLVMGRLPTILAGKPEEWMDYKPYTITDIKNGVVIGTISSKGLFIKSLRAADYLLG